MWSRYALTHGVVKDNIELLILPQPFSAGITYICHDSQKMPFLELCVCMHIYARIYVCVCTCMYIYVMLWKKPRALTCFTTELYPLLHALFLNFASHITVNT